MSKNPLAVPPKLPSKFAEKPGVAGKSSGKWQPAQSKSVCSNVVQRFRLKAKAMQPQPATLTCICAAPVVPATGPGLLKDPKNKQAEKKPHTESAFQGGFWVRSFEENGYFFSKKSNKKAYAPKMVSFEKCVQKPGKSKLDAAMDPTTYVTQPTQPQHRGKTEKRLHVDGFSGEKSPAALALLHKISQF